MDEIKHNFVIVLLTRVNCIYCERVKAILPLHYNMLHNRYKNLEILILKQDENYQLLAPHPFLENTNVLDKLTKLWSPLFFCISLNNWQKLLHNNNIDWKEIYIFDAEYQENDETWKRLGKDSMYNSEVFIKWVINCQQRIDNYYQQQQYVITEEEVNKNPNFFVDNVCSASHSNGSTYADLHCRWKPRGKNVNNLSYSISKITKVND
jgi:glutaredoxin